MTKQIYQNCGCSVLPENSPYVDDCVECNHPLTDKSIFYYCDDNDAAYCSQYCISAAEARGLQQAESQEENN